jgi:hypothetical protein
MRTAVAVAVLIVGVAAALVVVLPGSTERDKGCRNEAKAISDDQRAVIAVLQRRFARVSPPDRFPQRPRGELVAAVDPRTLDPRPEQQVLLKKRITSPWAYSPDRRYLALGDVARSSLRIVDLERWEIWRRLRLPGQGSPIHLAWPEDGRLLATTSGDKDVAALVVDPARGEVLVRELIPKALEPAAIDSDGTGVVMVLAPSSRVGVARFAVLSASGRLAMTRLSRIPAGSELNAYGHGRAKTPGLALAPASARAFVVAADAPVAEVGTKSLDVSYHQVETTRGGAHPGDGKAFSGDTTHRHNHLRTAAWLGCHTVAVAGTDFGRTGWPEFPAGLHLLDTRNWRSSVIDPRADYVVRAGDVLVATGFRDPVPPRPSGLLEPTGLTFYSPTGAKLGHLGGRGPTLLAAGDEYGYVESVHQPPGRVRVIRLGSGSPQGIAQAPQDTRVVAVASSDSRPYSEASRARGYP